MREPRDSYRDIGGESGGLKNESSEYAIQVSKPSAAGGCIEA